MYIFGKIKGDLLLKLKCFGDCFFKKLSFIIFNRSSSITYILLNNSNKAYFWHNVFNKLNRTFIFDGLLYIP